MNFLLFVVAVIVGLNCGYAALLVWLLRRRTPRPRWLVAAIWCWAMGIVVLSLLELLGPADWKPFMRHWLYFPFAVEMIWNVLSLEVLGLLCVALAIHFFRPLPSKNKATAVEGMSRRKFLYLLGYGAAPAVAVGMGVHGSLTRNDLRIRKFDIPIAGLPAELEGFSIAHVSDLHSGLFVGPTRLKIISDAANSLNADMVAITGDIINRSMDEFPAALTAMQQIRSRYGTYLCEGNHDVIPGPGVMVEACAKNNLPMLYNACTPLSAQGHRLLIAGLPWMGHDFQGQPEVVERLFPARQPGDVRILLAHHPHLFDIAQAADLVLSGHTHGGQIMFGPVGLGSLRFKYCSGRFQRGNTTMIVSNGGGDWFPCRIGAPAEIGLIRLTAAKVG